MQLTLFTDYSLRVLLYAAARPGRRCLTGDVAEAYGISRHHVVKVVNELQHLGYLNTTRGRVGGFGLARTPDRISIGDVVRKTESALPLIECFDEAANRCPLARACGLRGALAEAFEAFFATLDRYTLADFIAQPRWAAQLALLRPAR